MRVVTIEPAPGRRVLYPDGRVLTGVATLPWDTWWARALAAGDVSLVPDPPPARPAVPKPVKEVSNA